MYEKVYFNSQKGLVRNLPKLLKTDNNWKPAIQ